MPAGLTITAFALAAAMAWALLAIAWRRRQRATGSALLALAVAIAAWTTVSLTASLVELLPLRLLILRLQLALAMLTPAIWLWVAARSAFGRPPSRLAFVAVGGAAAAAAAAALIAPFAPGSIVAAVSGGTVGGRLVLEVEPGAWFWGLLLPFAYLLLTASAALLARAWRGGRGAARHQPAALLLAMLPPAAVALLQASGLDPLVGYDPTGLSLGASALVLVVALTVTDWFDRHSVAFHEVFLAMREAALVVAPDGDVFEANPAAHRLLSDDGRDLRGAALLAIAPQLEAARRGAERTGARRVLAGDLSGFEVGVSHLRDRRGALTASVLILHDQRQDREREARLLAASHRDGLTGIANRRGLEAAMAHALARRGDRAVGVAFIDLDGFKLVNDAYGHAAGDAVLIEVARRLTGVARTADTVARFGGDEFAILLRDVTPSALAGIAERIGQTLLGPIEAEGHTVRIGASVGLASAPRDGTKVDALLAKSDARMYRQKEARLGHRVTSETPPASG